MADERWVLEDGVLSDIQQTFVNSAAIYRRLITSHKVWDPKFVRGAGGRFSTANNLASAFLGVLRDVIKETPNVDGIHLGMARHLAQTTYAERIQNGCRTVGMVVKVASQVEKSGDLATAATITPFPSPTVR